MNYKIKVLDKKKINQDLLAFLEKMKFEFKEEYLDKNIYINNVLNKASIYTFKVKNPMSQDLISLKKSSPCDTHLLNSNSFNTKDIIDFSINAKYARLYNLFDFALNNANILTSGCFTYPSLLEKELNKNTEITNNKKELLVNIDEFITKFYDLLYLLKDLSVEFIKGNIKQTEKYTMNKQKAINICFGDEVEVGYVGVSTGFMLKMQDEVKKMIAQEDDVNYKDRKGQLRYKKVGYMNNEAKKQNLSVKMPYLHSTFNFEVNLNKNSVEYLWQNNKEMLFRKIFKNFKYQNKDLMAEYNSAIKYISGIHLKNYVEKLQMKIVLDVIKAIKSKLDEIKIDSLSLFNRKLLIVKIDNLLFTNTSYNRVFIIEYFLKELNTIYKFNN